MKGLTEKPARPNAELRTNDVIGHVFHVVEDLPDDGDCPGQSPSVSRVVNELFAMATCGFGEPDVEGDDVEPGTRRQKRKVSDNRCVV